MSVFLDPWIRNLNSDVSSTQRHVLIIIAAYIGAGDCCWATQAQIAQEAGLALATVNRAIRDLAKSGYIDCSYTTFVGRTRLKIRLNKAMINRISAALPSKPDQAPAQA